MATPSAEPTKNEIVRLFLAEANRIFEEQGVVVMGTAEIFTAIDQPFSFEVLSYLRKLDFIREESGSMFSLTERGKNMAQKE
ncbi:hypothetical protein KQI63_16725 [bacterium]|nr:hypothetical protein [bacterium]